MWSTILGLLKEYGTWVLEMVHLYGKKSVFIILLIVGIVISFTYIVDNRIKKLIPETIEVVEETRAGDHEIRLIETQQTYQIIKQEMKKMQKDLGTEYIFLFEYHNGSENMVSKFPFMKFDITLEVQNNGAPYIDLSGLKDEHIYKYDIFTDDVLTENHILHYEIDEFKDVDFKLHRLIVQNSEIKHVYICNINYDYQILGSCMLLSKEPLASDKVINYIYNLEQIFNYCISTESI